MDDFAARFKNTNPAFAIGPGIHHEIPHQDAIGFPEIRLHYSSGANESRKMVKLNLFFAIRMQPRR